MSTARRHPQSRGLSRRNRILLWLSGALLMLGVIGFLAGRIWIANYLRSEKFRAFVSEKTGETLQAEGRFAPFHVSGTSFYSEDFVARGTQRAWFADLRIDQIRADVSARRFWEHVWQIEQVSAQRIDIKIDGGRIELPQPPALRHARPTRRSAGLFPNRVEIGSAQVREANLQWGTDPENGGSVRGVTLAIQPRDNGWDFAGTGGQLEQGGFPVLDLNRLQLHYAEPVLFVQSAEWRQGAAGSVSVNGEVRFGDALDLTAKLNGISLTPLLTEDWRLRLHGNAAGELRIRTPLPARAAPAVSGSLTLAQGELEALPVLDQIALFTRTQQFRRLVLSKASADFQQENEKLVVRNFVAESEGLIRVEGNFTVLNGTIEGTFQVGVTPASLQWLPGSQERVFTQQRGAYVWTPMRLTGPLAKPKEDLSPRLIAAAQDAAIQGVEKTVRDTIKTGKDAAKGALDLLMPLLK